MTRLSQPYKNKNIQINKAIKYDVTPLYIVCQNGHINIVRVLIQYNDIDIYTASIKGLTPLSIAEKCGHIDIANLLKKTRHKKMTVNT